MKDGNLWSENWRSQYAMVSNGQVEEHSATVAATKGPVDPRQTLTKLHSQHRDVLPEEFERK